MAVNLGLLKLDLLARGVRPLAGRPEEFMLILPENTWVAVSQNAESPYQLVESPGGPRLRCGDEEFPARIVLPPKAYEKKTASGHRVGELLRSHGGFVAAAPRGPCRFARSGFACKYCGTKEVPHPTDYTPRDFVEALEILLAEVPAEIVNLSSGFVETEDGGLTLLEPLVREIRKHLNILISVDMMPPATNAWIDRTYAAGADVVYYDLDVFDPALFAQTYPDREKQVRQKRYLEALEYAVKIFPGGAVASHLVLGLEPAESTRRGIDELTDRGVVPIVTFFPAQTGSALATRWKPDLTEIAEVYAHLYKRVNARRLSTNWVRQIDVILTPLEGRHFAGGQSRLQVAIKNFYHTGIGRKAAVGFAALRRRLRVKEVRR